MHMQTHTHAHTHTHTHALCSLIPNSLTRKHTHNMHTHTHTHTHTLQQLNEQIAHYKDQLQELKAKTNLEAKFIKKECQVMLENVWYGKLITSVQ